MKMERKSCFTDVGDGTKTTLNSPPSTEGIPQVKRKTQRTTDSGRKRDYVKGRVVTEDPATSKVGDALCTGRWFRNEEPKEVVKMVTKAGPGRQAERGKVRGRKTEDAKRGKKRMKRAKTGEPVGGRARWDLENLLSRKT